jgi:hypothetical protein
MRVPDNGKDASQDTEHRAPAVVETRAVDLLLAALKDLQPAKVESPISLT